MSEIFETGIVHYFPGAILTGIGFTIAMIYAKQIKDTVSKAWRVIMIGLGGLIGAAALFFLGMPGIFDCFDAGLGKGLLGLLLGIGMLALASFLTSMIIYKLHGRRFVNNPMVKEIARYVKEKNASAVAVCYDGVVVLTNSFFPSIPTTKGHYTIEEKQNKEPADAYTSFQKFYVPAGNEYRAWNFRSLNYPLLWNLEIDSVAKGIIKRINGYKSKKFFSHVSWQDEGTFEQSDSFSVTYIGGGASAHRDATGHGPRWHSKIVDNFLIIVRNDLYDQVFPAPPKKMKKEKMNRW